MMTMPATRQAVETVGKARCAADLLRTRYDNVCMLRFLERIARAFNVGGIPLMALKGAALNLTIHDRPEDRPMADLDLMVRPEHAGQAVALLTELGCRRGRPLVREDFFPRFHYEAEFVIGQIHPVRIDLHVRPFRPLSYARRVPLEAFWRGARSVRVGCAEVLVPAPEDMLIHLAAHSAIHANERRMWLEDIQRWAQVRGRQINWDRFCVHARAWRLVLPVREALDCAERLFGEICPPETRARLAGAPVGWRDRLVLRQAPRDAAHPVGHVLADVLCTPGWRFVLSYLRAVLLPDRRHMGEWYDRRHWGWLPAAHVLRFLSPAWRRIPWLARRFSKIEVREGNTAGPGVFATRVIRAGARIAREERRACAAGAKRRRRIGGKLDYLHHSCAPNARMRGGDLRALRVIDAGEEITRDYGPHACTCRRRGRAKIVEALPANKHQPLEHTAALNECTV